VSRSEYGAEDVMSQYRGRNSASSNDFGITISVSYKTLVLIFAMFKVAERVVDVLFNWLG